MMAIDAQDLSALVDQEMEHLSDARVVSHIRKLRIEPKAVLRDWDYGEPNEKYICWTVLEHDASNTGVAYCESGFGPRCSWGLIKLSGTEGMSMGMDSGWFSTFLEAYFDSFASTELPVWRVFKTDASGTRQSITDEGSWDTTWERISEYRKADPESRYDCGHGVQYGQSGDP